MKELISYKKDWEERQGQFSKQWGKYVESQEVCHIPDNASVLQTIVAMNDTIQGIKYFSGTIFGFWFSMNVEQVEADLFV